MFVDDPKNLDHLATDFVSDPLNKHLFPSVGESESEEEEVDNTLAVQDRKKAKTVSSLSLSFEICVSFSRLKFN